MNLLLALVAAFVILGSVLSVSLVNKAKTVPPLPSVPPVSPPQTVGKASQGSASAENPTDGTTPKSNAGSKATTGPAQGTTSSEFSYPNSVKIAGDGSNFTLQSADAPRTVTDWYKNRILQAGMKTTSFVQTSTNGNVLNSLVGAGNGHEVKVEIKKSSVDSQVTIVVSQKLSES